MMINKQTIKPFALFLAILMLVTYGSLGSGEEAGKLNMLKFPNSDKVIHGVMYFLLTASLIYFLIHLFHTFKSWKIYLVAIASPIIYGFLMELLQYLLTTTRNAEFWDFFANTVGVLTAFLVSLVYFNYKETM